MKPMLAARIPTVVVVPQFTRTLVDRCAHAVAAAGDTAGNPLDEAKPH